MPKAFDGAALLVYTSDDMMPRKKRGRKKLSDTEIEAIRAEPGLQADIAIRRGITQAQVSRIKNGKRRVKR